MIGTRFQKPLQDDFLLDAKGNKTTNNASNTLAKYSECAQWCCENKATIEDRGDYYEVVAVPEPSNEELATRVRSKRDALLEETDYLAMPDYPSNPQNLEELKVYRQALRDVPKQEGFPRDVRWPDVPKFLCKDSESEPLGLAKVGI